MAHYNKGANAERELIRLFWDKGFAVARVAGSGKNVLPMPDLIVLGKDRRLIIEAKAWRAPHLSINALQMGELLKWGERGGAEVFVAWKYPNKGWFFVKPGEFNIGKNYNISFEKVQRVGVLFPVLIGEQSQLGSLQK